MTIHEGPDFRRSWVPLRRCSIAWAALVCASGCGGAAPPAKTTVFDPSGARPTERAVDIANVELEHPYPPLDGEGWMGVAVLRGTVRFSRPRQWSVRDASIESGYSFIRYVSPRAYSFAVYERKESPGRAWRDLTQHFEEDVTAVGAKMAGQRVPFATNSNQGRAFMIERKIDSKPPTVSHSREIMLRGAKHVVLVQIVTEDDNLARISAEVLDVLRRIEVL